MIIFHKSIAQLRNLYSHIKFNKINSLQCVPFPVSVPLPINRAVRIRQKANAEKNVLHPKCHYPPNL